MMEDELSQNVHKMHQSLTKVMLTMTALSTAPEWEDEETPSLSLKLLRLSSTRVKSWSTPELRAEGVLGEPGWEEDFCTHTHM
jgi:hypothetical protein